MKVDELVHKLKDPFARCWNPETLEHSSRRQILGKWDVDPGA